MAVRNYDGRHDLRFCAVEFQGFSRSDRQAHFVAIFTRRTRPVVTTCIRCPTTFDRLGSSLEIRLFLPHQLGLKKAVNMVLASKCSAISVRVARPRISSRPVALNGAACASFAPRRNQCRALSARAAVVVKVRRNVNHVSGVAGVQLVTALRIPLGRR